jgi:TRAP-type C4-dicarboxylate transport system permease small subunit
MNRFAKIVHRMEGISVAIGICFLLGIMVLAVSNIISRACGNVIAGTYEIIGLAIVVTVVFALGYTELEKNHIVVRVLVDRFPQRVRAIVYIITSFISLGVWALIAWAAVAILRERWLMEESQLLEIPYFPIRFIWVLGLLVFCLVLLFNLLMLLSQRKGK